MTMKVLSSLLEVAGIAMIAYGAGLWSLPVGIALGGVGLVAIGVLLDPPAVDLERRRERSDE